MLGHDPEHRQHLIEHLAVLAGDGNDRLELVGAALQLQHERAHLDCLGPRPKDEHHFHHKTFLLNRCGLVFLERFNNLCRNADRDAARWNVSGHNGTGTDNRSTSYVHWTDNHCVRADLDVLSEHGNLIQPRCSTDGHSLRDMTPRADNTSLVDDDPARLVTENGSFSDICLVRNNPPPI